MAATNSKLEKQAPLLHWKKNPTILESLAHNGISIEVMDAKSIDQVKKLIEKNKDGSGFAEMDLENFNTKLDAILSQELKNICYVAKEKFTGKVLGFIILEHLFTDDMKELLGGITEMGVDVDFQYQQDAKANAPKNIGSSLLLIGCNELFSTNEQCSQVVTTVSNSAAEKFYTKYHFKPFAEDTISIPKSQYAQLEAAVLSRSALKKTLLAKSITATTQQSNQSSTTPPTQNSPSYKS